MKVYNTKEVADILQITQKTVLKLINEGKLPAKKVARKWRVTENQLKKFLEEDNEYNQNRLENKDNDLAKEILEIFDNETRDMFGEEKAMEIRKNINKSLKEKGLEPISWEKDS